MRLLTTVLVIVLCAAAVNFFRGGQDFPLPQAIPACDGKPFNVAYFLGGLALIVLMLQGLGRLRRRGRYDE